MNPTARRTFLKQAATATATLADQKETAVSEDWGVARDSGFVFGIGRMTEVIDISVWA